MEMFNYNFEISQRKKMFTKIYNDQLYDNYKNCNEEVIICYCNFGRNYGGLNETYLKNFTNHCKTKKHMLYIDEEYENDKKDNNLRYLATHKHPISELLKKTMNAYCKYQLTHDDISYYEYYFKIYLRRENWSKESIIYDESNDYIKKLKSENTWNNRQMYTGLEDWNL